VTRPARARDLPLDFLRGVDVMLMLLVNFQVAAAPAILRHAAWHGLTLADIVFPIFLFIVGLSASLAFDGRLRPMPWSAIARRGVMLFAIGVALNWCLRPELDWDQLRWTGVLQRVAIVYLACAAIVSVGRGAILPLGLALAIIATHTFVLLNIGAGNPVASLAPGAGISGWLDRQFLPGLKLRDNWDPEGILSTLPSMASGFLGIALARWASAPRPIRRLAFAGILLVLAGLLVTIVIPINKNLWTASFVLVTSGIGALGYAAVRAVWPVLQPHGWAKQFVAAGQAALTIYVIHMLVIALLRLPRGGEDRLWDRLLAGLQAAGLSAMSSSVLFAVLAVILCRLLLVPLQRRGLLLRV
jgi:predicted acyltransferase